MGKGMIWYKKSGDKREYRGLLATFKTLEVVKVRKII